MKKILLPILILMLLTGCTKINSNTTEYSNIINDILIKNNRNVNTASLGYKYYIPIGVNLTYDEELNKKFKIKNNEVLLYVDIVSYYYKNNNNYKADNTNSYYYANFNNGYINIINSDEDYYFLEIYYNYGKIESYVNKNDLIDVIINSTIILNSISYNDNLISNFIKDGAYIGKEKKYELKKPKNTESQFSEYLQEYVQDPEDDEKEKKDTLFEQK